MLGIFQADSNVVADFTINVLEPTSAKYNLYDGLGNAIASDIAVPIAFDNIIKITIPNSYNTLPAQTTKALRKLELLVSGASGEVDSIVSTYIIQENLELKVPHESFITISDATLLAFDLFGCEDFVSLNDSMKRQLLIHASKKIKRLAFSYQKIKGEYHNGLDWYPQDRINPNNAPPFLIKSDMVDFYEMTTSEFEELPERFKKDVAEACIWEASSISDPNEVERSRQLGITSETIGEVSLTLKSGIVPPREYSKDAIKILSRYLTDFRIVRRS